MLEAFRKVSKNIVFKILFGILLLSFALSGLTGVSRMHFSSDYRVKVGNERISQQAVDFKYDQQVRNLRRRGIDLNEEQLAAQGVSKEQTIRMMIQDSLIRQQVADIGIEVGDEAVADQIKNNPAFQIDGKFDRNQFNYTIMNSGFRNEAKFTANLYNDIKNSILLATIEYNVPVNDFIAKEITVVNSQKRDIEIAVIPKELRVAAGDPGAEEIKNFYAENSIQFQIPETRDVNYIKFDKKKYSDTELEALTIKIEDELAAGSTLKEIAAKLKLQTENKTGLTKEGAQGFSPLFLDTAFTRDVGQGMDLILDEENGQYFIIEVTKIDKARIPELNEVKQEVVKAWKEENTNTRNLKYLDELVEKLKSSKESLSAFAARNGYKYQVIKDVMRKDTEEYGARLVNDAFSVNEGEIIGSFQNEDGTYKIAALKKIKSAALAAEDEAKFKAGIGALLKVEIMDQYLEYLKKKFPLKEKSTAKESAALSMDQPVPKPVK